MRKKILQRPAKIPTNTKHVSDLMSSNIETSLNSTVMCLNAQSYLKNVKTIYKN